MLLYWNLSSVNFNPSLLEIWDFKFVVFCCVSSLWAARWTLTTVQLLVTGVFPRPVAGEPREELIQQKISIHWIRQFSIFSCFFPIFNFHLSCMHNVDALAWCAVLNTINGPVCFFLQITLSSRRIAQYLLDSAHPTAKNTGWWVQSDGEAVCTKVAEYQNIRTILSGRCAHYTIGDMFHKFVVCANGLSAGSEEEAPKIKDL